MQDEAKKYEPLNINEQYLKEHPNELTAVREWERAFMKYTEGKGPKPKEHPNPQSQYNTNPELYDFGEEQVKPNFNP